MQRSSKGLVILVMAGIVAVATAVPGATQQNYFTDWPAMRGKEKIGLQA
jgi:hypothetical protein